MLPDFFYLLSGILPSFKTYSSGFLSILLIIHICFHIFMLENLVCWCILIIVFQIMNHMHSKLNFWYIKICSGEHEISSFLFLMVQCSYFVYKSITLWILTSWDHSFLRGIIPPAIFLLEPLEISLMNLLGTL